MSVPFDYKTAVATDFFNRGLVEVLGENGVFYPAFILDVDEPTTDDKPRDSFENSSTAATSHHNQAAFGSDSKPDSTKLSSVNSLDEPIVTVLFHNNSHPKRKVALNRIRLPPNCLNVMNGCSPVTNNDGIANDDNLTAVTTGLNNVNLANASNTEDLFPFTVGMEVEVWSSLHKEEPKGWWRAVIKMIKGTWFLFC